MRKNWPLQDFQERLQVSKFVRLSMCELTVTPIATLHQVPPDQRLVGIELRDAIIGLNEPLALELLARPVEDAILNGLHSRHGETGSLLFWALGLGPGHLLNFEPHTKTRDHSSWQPSLWHASESHTHTSPTTCSMNYSSASGTEMPRHITFGLVTGRLLCLLETFSQQCL